MTLSMIAAIFKRQNRLAWAFALCAAMILSLTTQSGPAKARQAFATIAIDARSGEVLYARNADSRRFPASLTKIMTLYLLFEDVQAGRLKLDSRLRVSKYAAGKPPSKLGLKPGQTIRVRDAIRALVTKSANDVAATVAENLSGSESAFAKRMTRKARSLGMTRTTFRNASGLPNKHQVTTVRDMATLALRIHRDFPSYYKYFSLRKFSYKGRRYRNHNRLLGKVSGVDGIKTGYTRASGFNLVSSARRGKKRVIAVVVGAKSGGSRNRYMTSLIDRMFDTKRLTSGRHLARVAGSPPGYSNANSTKDGQPKPRKRPATRDYVGMAAAAASATATPTTIMKVEPSSADPIAEKLKTEGLPTSHPDPAELTVAAKQEPKELPKTDLLKTASLPETKTTIVEKTVNKPNTTVTEPALEDHLATWNIQIGAFPTPDGAKSRLQKAMEKAASNLRGKKPFTMKYSKGGDVYYRARFSGFNRKTAKRACKTLSRKGVRCFALAPKI